MSSELVKILDAAEKLFKKYGIRSVTMADIAFQLGISKKTIYKQIENKNDLVARIMNRYIANEKQMCENIAAQPMSALEHLLRIFVNIQKQISEIHPAMFYDLQKYHSSVWKLLEDFQQDYVHRVTEMNLKQGVEEGIYRADINTFVMAKIYVNFIPVLSNVESLTLEGCSAHEIHQEFIKYHIHGIVSEKGRQILLKLTKNNELNLFSKV